MRNTSTILVLWNIIYLLCVEAMHVVIQPNETMDVNAVGGYTKADENNNHTQIEITGEVSFIDNGLPTESNLPALLTLINTFYKNGDFKLFVGIDSNELSRYSVNGPAAMSEDGTKLIVDITLQDEED